MIPPVDVMQSAESELLLPAISGEAVAADAEGLLVSRTVEPGDLRRLLESLRQEDCAHSWKNFDPDGSLDELLQWENELRPTQIFFFYVSQGGKNRLAAASAIADRLVRSFPHTGFCVLGRCYVMPEFRRLGLYRRILRYRLEYCRSRYGGALNAVHIGSDNQHVGRVLTDLPLPGWPRFVHLGNQELKVDTKTKLVGAYLLMEPAYLGRLRLELAGPQAPAEVDALRQRLAASEAGEPGELGMVLKQALESPVGSVWFAARSSREVDKLKLFCRLIPLVGF